jgi:hypothetical protein
VTGYGGVLTYNEQRDKQNKHTQKQKTKQGNLYHLENSNTINAIALNMMRPIIAI